MPLVYKFTGDKEDQEVGLGRLGEQERSNKKKVENARKKDGVKKQQELHICSIYCQQEPKINGCKRRS